MSVITSCSCSRSTVEVKTKYSERYGGTESFYWCLLYLNISNSQFASIASDYIFCFYIGISVKVKPIISNSPLTTFYFVITLSLIRLPPN